MGHHDDGLAELATDRRSRSSTSAPARESRFPVGSSAKTISRPAGQRAGDSDPLLLAAGQLAGPVPQPVAEADGADDGVQPRLVRVSGPRCPAAG